jgi:DNA-binding SARP family transcriptional activator
MGATHRRPDPGESSARSSTVEQALSGAGIGDAIMSKSSPTRDPGAAAPARGACRLALLGGFELTCEGTSVELPAGSERLVALLALAPRAVTRSHLAGTLWPEVSESRAAANLRSALWRLGPRRPLVIGGDRGRLMLADDLEVDVRELVATGYALMDGGADGATDVDIRLFSAELLPDWYDEWVLIERERLRQLSLHTLEALAARLSRAGEYTRAIEAALAAIRVEPLRESAARTLIEVHLAEGNQSEAVRQYLLFHHRLRRELGLAPSEAMRSLVAQLKLTPGQRETLRIPGTA